MMLCCQRTPHGGIDGSCTLLSAFATSRPPRIHKYLQTNILRRFREIYRLWGCQRGDFVPITEVPESLVVQVSV